MQSNKDQDTDISTKDKFLLQNVINFIFVTRIVNWYGKTLISSRRNEGSYLPKSINLDLLQFIYNTRNNVDVRFCGSRIIEHAGMKSWHATESSDVFVVKLQQLQFDATTKVTRTLRTKSGTLFTSDTFESWNITFSALNKVQDKSEFYSFTCESRYLKEINTSSCCYGFLFTYNLFCEHFLKKNFKEILINYSLNINIRYYTEDFINKSYLHFYLTYILITFFLILFLFLVTIVTIIINNK